MGALGDRKLSPTDERVKKQFIELCRQQDTKDEICAVLDVTPKTLQRWCIETYGMGFSLVYKRMSSGGKSSLRKTQFRHAETSPSMAMYLGKIYLNQKEKEDVHVVLNSDADDPMTQAIKAMYLRNSNNDNGGDDDDEDGSEE